MHAHIYIHLELGLNIACSTERKEVKNNDSYTLQNGIRSAWLFK